MYVYLKSGKFFPKQQVEIVNDMTDLVIYEPNGNYSVVPKSSIEYFDVEPCDDA